MIRLATWIVGSLLLTALIAWLISLPGTALIEVAGYRMQPRLGMAAFLVAAGLALVVIAWSVLRRILDAPRYFAKLNRDRRRDLGVAGEDERAVVGREPQRRALHMHLRRGRAWGRWPLAQLRDQSVEGAGGKAPLPQAGAQRRPNQGDLPDLHP